MTDEQMEAELRRDIRHTAGLADDDDVPHRINVQLDVEQREDDWWATLAIRHEPSGRYVPYYDFGPFQTEQQAWDYHVISEAEEKFGGGNA